MTAWNITKNFKKIVLTLIATLITFASTQPLFSAELTLFLKNNNQPERHLQPFIAKNVSDPRSSQCDIFLTGEIDQNDLRKFQKIFDYRQENEGFSYDQTFENGVLCLNSPGGSIAAALDVIIFLFKIDAGLSTRVLDSNICASACALLFLYGNDFFEGESYQTTIQRSITPGARLGLHAPSLSLPKGGQYSKSQVDKSFSLALKVSAEVFNFAQQRDSDWRQFMNPYLFTRFLETSPDEMYYVDSVGDALMADIPVIDVDVTVRLDAELIRTICDNVFMLDDGMFFWALQSTWKTHPLAASDEVLDTFSSKFKSKIQLWADDSIDVKIDAQIEGTEYEIHGYARGYSTGYPWTVQDCLVRIDRGGSQGNNVSLTELPDINEWNPIFQGIEVAVTYQDLHDTQELSPQQRWAQFEQDPDTQPRSYPWLIAFPLEMQLSDLPRIGTKRGPVRENGTVDSQISGNLDALDCDALWTKRNKIFHENGFCFGSERGQRIFGNEGCHTKSPSLSFAEANEVSNVKKMEDIKDCR